MVSAIIGGAAALGGAIYGSIASSNYANKARDLIAQQRADNKSWYESRKNEDYTQRADVQAAVKKQRELLEEQYKRARATNVVAGGTEESLALQKAAANKSLSDTMTEIAAQGAAYKDSLEQQYRSQDNALNQQQAQSYQQQAAQAAQAGSQMVNAGIGLVGNSLGQIKQTNS